MKTDHLDSAEKALAKEFSDYLASVSREIVDPISANVTKHQANVDVMLGKVADGRAKLEEEFDRQRKYLDNAGEKIGQLVADSESKLLRLHASHLALLETTRQRIITELKAVSDDAGTTVELISLENERTRVAIAEGHQAMRQVADDNKSAMALVVDSGKKSIDEAFESHRNGLDDTASKLLIRFEEIAEGVKFSTGTLSADHEVTRRRLFNEFAEYRNAAIAQIEAGRESLNREICEQINVISLATIDALGNGIAKRYEDQSASLNNLIEASTVATNRSEDTLASRLETSISKAVANATLTLSESNAEVGTRLSKDILVLRNLLIFLMAGVCGLAALVLAFRF